MIRNNQSFSEQATVLRWPGWDWLVVLLAASGIALGTVWLMVFAPVPLGVPGEWVWNRMPGPPPSAHWVLLIGASGVHLAACFWGGQHLRRGGEGWLALWFPMSMLTGGGLLAALIHLPQPGLGIERWPIVLAHRSTTGYFEVARSIDDAPAFFRNFNDWIIGQDSFHIGTHPPGLFWGYRALLDHCTEDQYGRLVRWTPKRFQDGLIEGIGCGPLSSTEENTLVVAAFLTFLATWGTMPLLYLWFRQFAGPVPAWWGMGIWPTVPGVSLFLPLADAAFVFIAVLIMALGAIGLRRGSWVTLFAAGLATWIGLVTTLAFAVLATLIILWIALDAHGTRSAWRTLLVRWVTFKLGLLLPTLTAWVWLGWNLPATWWINYSKHAGFYEQMPRTHSIWIMVNGIEFTLVAGPLVSAAALASLICHWGKFPPGLREGWSLDQSFVLASSLTILVLALSGKNSGEVARLWIFLLPIPLTWMVFWMEKAGSPRGLVASGMGLQIVAAASLLGFVEPLLPVRIEPFEPQLVRTIHPANFASFDGPFPPSGSDLNFLPWIPFDASRHFDTE